MTLLERVGQFVGRPFRPGGPVAGPDPVNQAMIRHWAAAFEDDNPIYTDPVAAAQSRFGAVVAPPLMLQTWTMPTPVITGIAERGGTPTPVQGENLLSVFDDAGFTGTRACNSEFEVLRYLHLGEVVSSSTLLESVSEAKQTRLGPGHFVTWLTTYTDGDGLVVGTQRFRILKFTAAPGAAGGDGGSGARTPPPGPTGVRLPDLEVVMTATRIVAGAIATRDFMPVHHDRAYARAQGAADIFMNILSTNAYASRYLSDWAGTEAMLRRLALRLGGPVHPGETLRFSGEATRATGPAGEVIVDVEFRADSDGGRHASGTATLSLPEGSAVA